MALRFRVTNIESSGAVPLGASGNRVVERAAYMQAISDSFSRCGHDARKLEKITEQLVTTVTLCLPRLKAATTRGNYDEVEIIIDGMLEKVDFFQAAPLMEAAMFFRQSASVNDGANSIAACSMFEQRCQSFLSMLEAQLKAFSARGVY
jgi:hypothetical protein